MEGDMGFFKNEFLAAFVLDGDVARFGVSEVG